MQAPEQKAFNEIKEDLIVALPEDPLMVKVDQQLYTSEEDKAQLEAARRPKPKHMKEPADAVEMCVQTMIDGMLDGGSHFLLVDKMNELQLEREEKRIHDAFMDGHRFIIVAMTKKVPVPMYWAGQEWTLEQNKAHMYTRFESLLYWRNKVFTRYQRILQMLLLGRTKGQDETSKQG